MKRIWLIRHGESIANAGEATQDHRNIPLSELGLKQAQALALQIPKKPDLIVTSPYLRAQQTAMCTIGRFPDTVTGIWDCVHEFVYLAPATCVGTTSQQRRPEQFILVFTHAQFIRNLLLVYENPGRPVEEYMAAFRRSRPVHNGQIVEITM